MTLRDNLSNWAIAFIGNNTAVSRVMFDACKEIARLETENMRLRLKVEEMEKKESVVAKAYAERTAERDDLSERLSRIAEATERYRGTAK